MTVIEMARELGKKIQQEESYIALTNAQRAVEEDEELQEKIAEFNMKRYELTQEITKADRDDKKIEELSKGMAQKVQFITTVLHEPKLLIFDEPFSGFDPVNAELLKQEILELRDKGATVIFSTHNMDSVERLCENIALIHQSQVVLSGNINDIRQQFSTNKYTATLQNCNTLSANDFNCANLLNIKEENNLIQAEFTLKPNHTPNHLLTELIPHATILHFEEQLPSMNDIFLHTVSK